MPTDRELALKSLHYRRSVLRWIKHAGAGHTGDGQADLRCRTLQCAAGHGPCHRLADRAVALDQIGRHAQHLVLGGVGVGDKAAEHGGRAAGNGRQRRRDQPARAGFGRGQSEVQ
jgi:hypothetical protein